MKTKLLTLGMITLMGLTACEKEDEGINAVKDMTIAQYAASDNNFSILVSALTKAGLVNALNGQGNFTVFAPTNDAFNALFTELGITGIDDLSAETLTPILLYHVLDGEKKSDRLNEGYYSTLSQSQNSFLSLRISRDGGVKVNKTTTVLAADVDVINGVIHAIDKVLLPPTVVDIALGNESFSILVQAVVKAGLAETLNGTGPFTIFAPNNAAFEKLFTQLGISGINDLTAEQLAPILLYHVVSGNVRSATLTPGNVETLNGPISIKLSPSPSINDSSDIILTDVQGVNGVIHVIDEVLIPSR